MTVHIQSTASLRADDLRELWAFRLSLIGLKPTVTPEQDFQAFAKDFDWPGYVWTQRSSSGLGGMFLQRGVPVTFEGQQLFCLLPEYGFTAPHLRGAASLRLGAAAVTARVAARYPLRRMYVAASTYPPGYIAFRRAIRPFWTLRDPALPAWERGLLLHLAEQVSGPSFCADGTVTMRTLPFEAPPPRSEEGRRFFAEYEAANPDWRQGRGLFFLFPLGPGTFARVVGHTARRALGV